MRIQFISGFAKKENSTKRPDGTVSLSLQGTLKMPCSIMNPVVAIERLANDTNPCVYTYALIPNFQRFYYVEDWVWADGLWEVHMKEDVLASWKTEIGQQEEYILRTNSTTDFNGDITDTVYPATTDVITESFSLSNVFTTDISVGCYIVGIISGGAGQSVGAITYYAMTSAQFGDLKEMLFSEDNLKIMEIIDQSGQQLVQDLSQEVLKTLYNPYQYIASCMWFPFGVSAIDSYIAVQNIDIGWWQYPLSGNRIYAQTLELGNEQFTITNHPQHLRGDYLNYAPYTRRTLLGRFGSVPLDTVIFRVGNKINISYVIDLITGQCYTRISRRDESGSTPAEDLIYERNFLLGVPIQIAQVGTDYIGTAVNSLDTAIKTAGGFAKGDLFGALSSGISGFYNALQSAMPQLETSGQNGSFLAPANNTHVIEQFYTIVDEDITHKGRPLCASRNINELDGFVLCADGEIDIACFDNERQAIAKYLTSGFFWE